MTRCLAGLTAVLILLAVICPVCCEAPAESSRLLDMSDVLDYIAVDLTFSPDTEDAIQAEQTLRLTNLTGDDLTDIVLRSMTGAYLTQATSPAASAELMAACYPKGFDPGGVSVLSCLILEEDCTWAWTDAARTVLTVTPAHPWKHGETLTLVLTWKARIPCCRSRFGHTDGAWVLGNCIPLPAVYQDGTFRTDPYVSVGDPFLSACMNWHVRVHLPDGYAAVGSAIPRMQASTAIFEAHGLRDFTLVVCASPAHVRGTAEGISIDCYASDTARAQSLLTLAENALCVHTAAFGPLIYPGVTLIETDFPFSGMEYPRLVLIGRDVLDAGGDDLEETVVHELAHQWFAMQVGSDSFCHAWQDEALCEYAYLQYLKACYGEARMQKKIASFIVPSLRMRLSASLTPESPLYAFRDLREYSLVVYGRGTALFVALDEALGTQVLCAGLADYCADCALRIADPMDLITALSRAAQTDLTPLFSEYLATPRR
ncbi:MAG: hypothetical protein IJ246_07085 [Clostridia bacterium]|nr:hypothetical protein [Clostridia bacterium]